MQEGPGRLRNEDEPYLPAALGTPLKGWAPPMGRQWGATGGRARQCAQLRARRHPARPRDPHTARCGLPPFLLLGQMRALFCMHVT
eukprot:350643-Chlamydomonas_euryale.AAC.2